MQFLAILCINIAWVLLSPLTSKHKKNNQGADIPKTIYFNVLITWFSCSMLLMLLIILQNSLSMPIKIAIIIITVITSMLSMVTFLHYINSDNLKHLYFNRSIVLEQDLKIQNEYFSSINQQYEMIKSLNHDAKAHVFCMSTLLNEKKYTELQEYLDELIDKSNINKTKYYCSDRYVASIIYYLLPRIKESNIDFEFIYLLQNEMCLTSTEKKFSFL